MSDSFDGIDGNSWATAKGGYVPPAKKPTEHMETIADVADTVSDIAGAVAPIVPGAGQVKAIIDVLTPHLEAGTVSPEAAIVSLASALTKWIK